MKKRFMVLVSAALVAMMAAAPAVHAAEEISYAVIRAENCAEVLKKLTALIGKPTLLPKWAFGYIQSKERYKSSAELIETAAEFRRRGLGLDCIVLDWCSWRDGCWGGFRTFGN